MSLSFVSGRDGGVDAVFRQLSDCPRTRVVVRDVHVCVVCVGVSVMCVVGGLSCVSREREKGGRGEERNEGLTLASNTLLCSSGMIGNWILIGSGCENSLC